MGKYYCFEERTLSSVLLDLRYKTDRQKGCPWKVKINLMTFMKDFQFALKKFNNEINISLKQQHV